MNLQNSISSALAESLSNTGITGSTMDQLLGQFSELAKYTNMDLSSMFRNTAEGVKINTQALRELINVQKNVYTKSMFNSILKGQQAVINGVNKNIKGEKTLKNTIWNKAKTARKGDKSQLEGARAKLRAMNKEITGYNAIMEAIDKSISGYQKWQDAL